ncbi:hypothetical protein PQR05_24335 [Paraburkholderia sediminicola]|uniref:hypothetical protein n=1 Tax=Paraburkholderia sediminicola TaxID=458836 RepID=UPI0038BBCBEA
MFPLTSATVARGQRAWGRIKATAAEQRQLWKEVGEALLVGKQASNRAPKQTFSEWCDENGFADLAAPRRSDAMWFSENFTVAVKNLPADVTDPVNIRQWHRDQQEATPPTPEVDLSTSPAPRARISIETAKKVNKLASMAECGEGQEQQTAKKYLKKQAEKFGMEPEKLTELAAETDPMLGVGLSKPPLSLYRASTFRRWASRNSPIP